jgi:Putative neutral zinc metallopeptidase
MGQSATGPFYCAGDEKLYLDLAFFRDLKTRFRAPGDFAQAYVIAHEVGHHVQKLTGTFQKMEAARGGVSEAEHNRTFVRMELQADCYAGVWGHHAGSMNQLYPGDIAEALNAATPSLRVGLGLRGFLFRRQHFALLSRGELLADAGCVAGEAVQVVDQASAALGDR